MAAQPKTTTGRLPRLVDDRTPEQTLAHWFLEARRDDTQQKLWQVFSARGFSRLFYGARDAGELVRAWALQQLYAQRSHPGGAWPDPRIPAAFSQQAILRACADILGLHIWVVPEQLAHEADAAAAEAPIRSHPQLAWIVTYPEARPPDLCLRHTARTAELHLQMAMLMGYLVKERDRILDASAPTGLILLPTDQSLASVLHQFAIALLCLEPDCPSDAGCHCNEIRRRYNAPPPDHTQATDALQVAQIRAANGYGPTTSGPLSGPPSGGPRRGPSSSGR